MNKKVAAHELIVIPVVAEELEVGTREVEGLGVRVTKTISERTETVDVPLMEERAEVERVAVNRIVDAPPPVRYEGDVMIVPVLEEVLITEKRHRSTRWPTRQSWEYSTTRSTPRWRRVSSKIAAWTIAVSP